jgi:hypothetical protein
MLTRIRQAVIRQANADEMVQTGIMHRDVGVNGAEKGYADGNSKHIIANNCQI